MKSLINNLKLRTKLIIIYIIFIIIPTLLISQFVVKKSNEQIVNKTVAIQTQMANQISWNIIDLLSNYADICDRFCFDETLRTYLNPNRVYESNLESIEAYQLYLKPISYYNFSQKYSGASLNIFTNNETMLPGYDIFIYANNEVKENTIYTKAINAGTSMVWESKAKKITMARAMKNLSNNLIYGVVSIQINESSIYSLYQESVQQDGIVMLIDENGIIISSSNREIIGNNVNTESYFIEAKNKDKGILDYTNIKSYKVVYETIKVSNHLPNWHVITMIPTDNLLVDANKIRTQSTLIVIVTIFVSSILIFLLLEQATKKLKMLVNTMEQVTVGEFKTIDNNGSNDEVGYLIKKFNSLVTRLETQINNNYIANLKLKEMELKKKDAELYALQSQIKPHFLFNTLESIRMGLHNKGDNQISDVVLSLSKMLRSSLNWEGEITTLGKELELTKNYLEVVKYRFQDKISYSFNVDNKWLSHRIPKLILQPLVENSIKHGLEPKAGKGNITVTTVAQNNVLSIQVIDNGIGINKEKLNAINNDLHDNHYTVSGDHIGLRNIHERVRAHYGDSYGIQIESEINIGTTVILQLPHTYI